MKEDRYSKGMEGSKSTIKHQNKEFEDDDNMHIQPSKMEDEEIQITNLRKPSARNGKKRDGTMRLLRMLCLHKKKIKKLMVGSICR